MIRSTAHTIVRQGGLDARRSPDPGPLSSVTDPAPNLLAAARLALRVGGLTDSLTYPVVSGTGIKGGKKLCERAVPAGFRVVGRRRGAPPLRAFLRNSPPSDATMCSAAR